MSRKPKDNKMEVKPEVEHVDLRRAIAVFNIEQPDKALQLKDIEIIKLYVIQHIPELIASQAQWNEVLVKF